MKPRQVKYNLIPRFSSNQDTFPATNLEVIGLESDCSRGNMREMAMGQRYSCLEEPLCVGVTISSRLNE